MGDIPKWMEKWLGTERPDWLLTCAENQFVFESPCLEPDPSDPSLTMYLGDERAGKAIRQDIIQNFCSGVPVEQYHEPFVYGFFCKDSYEEICPEDTTKVKGYSLCSAELVQCNSEIDYEWDHQKAQWVQQIWRRQDGIPTVFSHAECIDPATGSAVTTVQQGKTCKVQLYEGKITIKPNKDEQIQFFANDVIVGKTDSLMPNYIRPKISQVELVAGTIMQLKSATFEETLAPLKTTQHFFPIRINPKHSGHLVITITGPDKPSVDLEVKVEPQK